MPLPRQSVAARVYRGDVKPLDSMPPAGLPGHTDAFAPRYGRAPNLAAAKRARRTKAWPRPFRSTLVDADALRGRVATSTPRPSAGSRGTASSGSPEVDRVGTVLRRPGRQYNAFQLGWFPDYVDIENYVVPFYRSDTFLANGYKSTRMDNLIKASLAARNDDARLASTARSRVAAEDAPIIPYWQANMIAVARNNVRGVPGTLDAAFIMRYWKISKS